MKAKIFIGAALVLSLAAALAGCSGKGRNEKLTDEQQAQLINAAEAFYESDFNYKEGQGLTNTQLEMFVYYLYNDELTAGANGFASVSLEEGDALVKTILGTAPMIHKNYKKDGSSPLYSDSRNYYIKVAPSKAANTEICSVTLGEDGDYNADITFTDSEGTATKLKMVFSIVDGGIRVTQCDLFATK